MSYDKVKQANSVVVGTKQTVRALKKNLIDEVVVAKDANPLLAAKVIETADELNVLITYVDSMHMLGKACEIEVGAAAVAIKK